MLTVLAGVACSQSATAPTSITADQLSGAWTLVALQLSGGAEQARPTAASYRITFEDGRISVRADCNTCTGAMTLSSTALTLGPALACTRAACATAAFESSYTAILAGEHVATLASRLLTLTSSRGILRFDR